MASPFDELAMLVGRVLANRWLREQQSLPSVRDNAARTQTGDDSQTPVISDQEEFDVVSTSESRNITR
jgi:hypothetical protein